jgi:ATP phosphoribosyltransferase
MVRSSPTNRRVNKPMIRLGLPKGRMASDARRFCDALGVEMRAGVLRYRAAVGNVEVMVHLLKAPDVAWLLNRGLLDLGLVGDEWLMEVGIPFSCRCFEVQSYSAILCLLMARGDPRSVGQVRSVATPYPRLAQRLLRDVAPGSAALAVAGSSEALVPDIADACLDVVETGQSAALNGLTVRASFDPVTTHLVRSRTCDRGIAGPVVELLAGAMELTR